ncbi:hypothetical protein PVL29_001957 [Vitis rotundifolia]|uniref:VTT domain-containing protein n=2 Tax=Vitis rotundifolia TaxID=103349 RepID=A0AA39AFV0_VITRO|nr:hypothetical protein PVL29_001957 [Vitis rotundifolia]
MTFEGGDDDGGVVPELTLRMGDYVKLRQSAECEEEGFGDVEPSTPRRRGLIWWWVKVALLCVVLGVLAGVFLKWVGPFFMDKFSVGSDYKIFKPIAYAIKMELMPIINWETTTFSTPVLALVIFGSVALFPTLLLPSTPSMWVAGMTFGYGLGFLLILAGVAVGVSLPYFIGSLFHHKIQGWLEKYPKKASIIRLAGEGNWFHQFRAVTLIRVSPFPYILFNYCSVATNVKYGPYIMGSLIGVVPEIFVAIYTGILIRALADASHEQHSLSAPQIILNVVGFCATVATTIFFTVYAKRQLTALQKEDELLLE